MADLEIILVSASVEVNDDAVTVEANTLALVEGQGESTLKAATRGGVVVMISSEDISTKVGMIKFEMPASVGNMDLSKSWKSLRNGLTVVVSGTDENGNVLTRTLTQGVMTNDPEKSIQNEGKIQIEFSGASLIT